MKSKIFDKTHKEAIKEYLENENMKPHDTHCPLCNSKCNLQCVSLLKEMILESTTDNNVVVFPTQCIAYALTGCGQN